MQFALLLFSAIFAVADLSKTPKYSDAELGELLEERKEPDLARVDCDQIDTVHLSYSTDHQRKPKDLKIDEARLAEKRERLKKTIDAKKRASLEKSIAGIETKIADLHSNRVETYLQALESKQAECQAEAKAADGSTAN